MPNDWIIEVLEDLREFAQSNNLPALEIEIERMIPVARAELTLAQGEGCSASARRG